MLGQETTHPFHGGHRRHNRDKLKKPGRDPRDELEKVAQKLGIKLSQLALSWCLKNQNVSTVILGASKVEQLQENLQARDYVKLLDTQIMGEIETIVGTKPQMPIDYLIS